MRHPWLLLMTALLLAGSVGAGDAPPDTAGLIGVWRVGLRPTPDADSYFQEFVVSRVDGNTFEGSFYGTPVEHGRINADWGAVHFAFVTRDGTGAYNSSGVLADDALSGTTHALGRGFLAVWTVERAE